MVGRHSDMSGALLHHAENRGEHASHGGHLPAVAIADRGERVVVPEQFVSAIDEVNVQRDAPEKTIRLRLQIRLAAGRASGSDSAGPPG